MTNLEHEIAKHIAIAMEEYGEDGDDHAAADFAGGRLYDGPPYCDPAAHIEYMAMPYKARQALCLEIARMY